MNKKYKILLTNRILHRTGGTEIYCYYLSKFLSLNHQVYVYSKKYGLVAERISKYAELLSEPRGEFDIILFNHNTTVSDDFKAKCKIFTMHGLFNKLERPAEGMNAYVAISKEIVDRYKELNPVLIPNGVDTEIFKPRQRDKNPEKNLLYSSNYKNNFSKLLKIVAFSLGVNYRRLGLKNAKLDVVDDLDWADIVVGVGRTAIEAMSLNKKIIVADKRAYAKYGMDGFLTQENIDAIADSNFSGRSFRKHINFFSIRREIKKALADTSVWERDWILNHRTIQNSASAYLELAEKIMRSKA